MDGFLKQLQSMPIWGYAITVLLLVVANRMSKTERLHNLVLVAAWGLCVASLYFTRPISDLPLYSRLAVTTIAALCLGLLLYWLFWEPSESVTSPRARKVVSATVKLLRKVHNMRPLDAIRQSGAAMLSNEEVIAVHTEIAARNLGPAFSDAIQPKDYLKFLKFSVEQNLPLGSDPEIYEATEQFFFQSCKEEHNPLILALEELDAIYVEGDHMATLFQCEGAKLPTFEQMVAWNEKAVACAKRKLFADHISTQDWAKFKEDWNFADCQRIERVLREHGCLDNTTDTQCAGFKYLWGRVKRLGELIAKIKGLPADENKTPIESLTDFLLKVHSLLDVFANLAKPLPLAEQNDLFEKIRLFLRKTAPEYVDRFNEIIAKPPTRPVDFPADFTDDDKKEWYRTRSEPCDRLHATAAHLSRIISDLRPKLPS